MMQMYALRLKPGTYPPPLSGGMYVAQKVRTDEISFTPDLRAAKTWNNYHDVYSYLDQNLYGMAEIVVAPAPSTVKIGWAAISNAIVASLREALPMRLRSMVLWQTTVGIALISGVVVTTLNWNNSCHAISNNCNSKLPVKPLNTKIITIGIVSAPPNEDYGVLAVYLQSKLNRLVKIERDTPFEQVSERITHKTWDIAFTRSPIFSIQAESNHYLGVARMFPKEQPYYQAALYVRSDSPIKSLADIQSRNTIALGNPESAPTFYLPIYALYGKSLRVGTGYRPSDVVELVKAGKVDIGVGRYTVVKNNSALRIIYVSRDIPGAGVYLSPLLSTLEQQEIKAALLTAPNDIQTKANYSDAPIPQYDELKKIIFKTDKILKCPDYNINSFNLKKTVDLFCSHQESDLIEGEIKRYKGLNQGSIQFRVVTTAGQIYLVVVPKQILNQIPITPTEAISRTVQIKDVKPRLLSNGTRLIKVTQLEQISL